MIGAQISVMLDDHSGSCANMIVQSESIFLNFITSTFEGLLLYFERFLMIRNEESMIFDANKIVENERLLK